MPTRGSDTSSDQPAEGTEETTERPARRRASPRTPATRTRTTSRTKKSESVAEETRASDAPLPPADDFGDGVESESRPARRQEHTPIGRSASRRPAADRPAADRAEPERTQSTESQHDSTPRQLAFFSSDEIDFGDSEPSERRPRSRRRVPEPTADSESSTTHRHRNDSADHERDGGADEPIARGVQPSIRRPLDRNRSDRDRVDHNSANGDRGGSDRGESEGFDANEFLADFDRADGDADDYGPGDDRPAREGSNGTDDDRRPRRRRRRRRRPGTGDARGGSDLRPAPDNRGGAPDNRGGAPDNRGGTTDNRGPSGDTRGPSGVGGGRHDNQRSRGRRRGGSSSGGGGRPGGQDDRPRRGRDGRSMGGDSSRDRGQGGLPRRARQVQPAGEPIEGTFDGVLELHPKGYGFLRDPTKNYAAEDSNPFVSSTLVEKYQLREGVLIRGDVGMGTRNQGPRLREVELIDGFTPEDYTKVKHFDDLTPINPFEQIRLETGPRPLTMRVMDLLCPIGKGQRALLVAPPRTGKTMLLQDIAHAVSANHPEIHLMVLLIDERPEEVTEIRRVVNGEVISSSLDHDVESHIRISQLIIERGKRLAEEGKDVFILLDSITRMARAFNKWSNSGRTATGGLDIRALDIPKKLFGTARRFDEGGSLTVCGTALIDTGSRMDEAIFQEFKGTGNMEMVLSRDLADRRIWPSIDVGKSGTRREEKILAPDVLDGTTLLRRSLISLNPVEAMEQLTRTMDKFPTNKEFLQKIRAVL